MLKIVNNGFKEPMLFEYVLNGKAQTLQIVQMTIQDEMRKAKLEREAQNNEELSEDAKSAAFLMARVACCIKTEEGEYAFQADEVLPSDVILALLPHCAEMNPLPEAGETLETRKKKS